MWGRLGSGVHPRLLFSDDRTESLTRANVRRGRSVATALVTVLRGCLADARAAIGAMAVITCRGTIVWVTWVWRTARLRGGMHVLAAERAVRGFQLLVSRDQAYNRVVFSCLSGVRLILAVTQDLMRARGVPMCVRCDPPDPVQAGQVSMSPTPPSRGDLASVGCCSRADEMRGAGPASQVPRPGGGCRGCRCRVPVPPGRTARVMSSRAIPGSHVVRAVALRFEDDEVPGGARPARARARLGCCGAVMEDASSLAGCIPHPGRGSARDPHRFIPASPAMALLQSGRQERTALPRWLTWHACWHTAGSQVRHLPVSSWRPFPPVRSATRTLTARTPITGPHAGFKHGNAMSDHGRDGTQRLGAASGDPGRDEIRLVSDVGPGRQDSLAGGWTPGASGGISPGCVLPSDNRQDVAAGPSVRGCKACGEIGGSSGNLGCGDRASLPGRPARYRVIWLVCARCGAETPRLFYDERDLPVCAGSAEVPHGRMELRQ